MRISSNQIIQRITSEIMSRHVAIADAQEQVSTGKKVNKPSDDPAAAGQLITLESATSQLSQYDRNASAAETRLVLEETALSSISESIMRLRELALTANSGAVDDAIRSALAAEVDQRLNEIFDVANSRDANGDYLFSGSNGNVQPFHRQLPVSYAGSDDNNQLPIGLGRHIQLGDSGADVFQRIRNGNGNFQTSQMPINTGTALISAGAVTDVSTYDLSSYEIEFVSANQFNVTNTDTGAAIQTGVPYADGFAIEFGGISVNLTGVPAVGDKFTIQPSANQDMFTTVSNFASALQNSPNSPSERVQQQHRVNSTITELDQILAHINTMRSRVGSRLSTLDSGRDENAAVQLQLSITRASIEDADITETVIRLQANVNSLETLHKSYARIQNMSLFNFI